MCSQSPQNAGYPSLAQRDDYPPRNQQNTSDDHIRIIHRCAIRVDGLQLWTHDQPVSDELLHLFQKRHRQGVQLRYAIDSHRFCLALLHVLRIVNRGMIRRFP